jgi:hypothetical protein
MINIRGFTKLLLLCIVGWLFLTACNSPAVPEEAQPVDSVETREVVQEVVSPGVTSLPSSTPTPFPTSTYTLTPNPTATGTPTLAPSPTPTATPTATPNSVQPGLYSANGCVTIGLSHGTAFRVDFCVVRIEVDRNGYMLFNVTWTAHMPSYGTITKGSDVGNRNMYLTDELGNRYDHIGLSGAAAMEYNFNFEGATTSGAYIFPPAHPGAHIFTFHDDDNRDVVANLVLINPTIIREVSELAWYPFAVEYLLENWTGGRTPEGGVFLTHNQYPTCQLIEWAPSEVTGRYRNTMDLGPVTYEIYSWNETDYSVREYLGIDGLAGITEDVQPLFHMQVPYENSQDCVFDASEVLGTLFEVEP